MAINFNDVVNGTNSASNKAGNNNFINLGGQYKIISGSENSHYVRGLTENGQVGAGVIFINVDQVAAEARPGISFDQALAEVVAHELGHFNNRTSDAFANARTEAQKANWYFEREGKAALYAFKVASEANANGVKMGVAGVTGEADLYMSLLIYSATLGNPQSNAYERAMIKFIAEKFAKDPQYQKAMQEFLDSSPSSTPGDGSYIPPSSGGDGGGGFEGGGGGGSGPIGTVTPINLPPPEPPYTFNPSSLPNYADSLYDAEISLVGLSVSSNQVLI